jgi:hypothetical protein
MFILFSSNCLFSVIEAGGVCLAMSSCEWKRLLQLVESTVGLQVSMKYCRFIG